MVAAATVAAGLAACRDAPEPAATVRVAVPGAETLLPGEVTGPAGAQVLSALFTPLVAFDDQGRPYGAAAAAVESDDGGRTWTVRLRRGYRFHDGEPVTAQHYVMAWSYAAHRRHGMPNHYAFSRIAGYDDVHPRRGAASAETLSGLEVVDDHTFSVRLSAPFAEFAAMLAAPAFYPLPSAAFDDEGQVRDAYARAPVGNGPYRLAPDTGDARAADRLVLHPVAGHPAAGSRPARLVLVRSAPEDAQRAYQALRAGEVDVVSPAPAEGRSAIAAALGERFVRRAAPRMQYLAVPAHERQYADPRVRRAVSLALEREALAAALPGGGGAPARGFAPPGVPGAQADGCGDACRHDPQRARELYARADGPDEVTITYNADGDHDAWLALACEQVTRALDVGCRLRRVPDVGAVARQLDAGEPTGLVRLGWGMQYPSVHSYFAPLFASTGAANLYGYRSAEADALLAAAATGGEDRAREAYRRLRDLLVAELPALPVGYAERTAVHAARVTGVVFTPAGYLDLGELALRTAPEPAAAQ